MITSGPGLWAILVLSREERVLQSKENEEAAQNNCLTLLPVQYKILRQGFASQASTTLV
jgi:hypothetical protein